MPEWSLACPDWRDRLKTGRTLIPDLPLNKAEADRAVAVFNRLRLADVPGNPSMQEAAGEWFRDIVRAVFGSLDPVTQQRAIREFLCLVPKKNSKTSYGALLMLTALLLNKRPKGSLILTAPTQDITQLAFDQAAGAVALDPVLSKKLHVREHIKAIVHRETKATLDVMTFDPSVLTGQKPVAVLIDELHVCSKMSKSASAIRQLRGGMLPMPEAFLGIITTQSEEPPGGVFRAELMKARAIRDGRQAGRMLPVLYEFPEEMQKDRAAWEDPANWPMVTPNNGRSITVDRLKEEFATAKATGEDELRAWASQHLNVEIGLALQSNGWAGADVWETAGDPALTLDDVLDRSDVVAVGIDGGGLDDLLGFGVIGREKGTRRWLHWGHAFAHPIAVQRRKESAGRYEDFQKAGDLTLVDELPDDIGAVIELVQRVEDTGKLAGIGLDQIGIGGIVDALSAIGITIDSKRVVGIPQGWRMAGAIKTVERKLADGTFAHGGQPLMAWCVGNARVEPRGNAFMITRQAAGAGKIDPLIALFNAASLMALDPEPRGGKSFWDK